MSTARRIADEVTAKIRSGEWRPGFRIPFETDLAAQYGCARATANKAMAGLASAGLIERRRRGGSFVARPPIQTAVLEIPDIGQLITARGGVYGFTLLQRDLRPAEGSAERALKAADPVLALTGIHTADATPFALESRILNLVATPDAAAEDFTSHAPGSWLLQNIPWTEAKHRITALSADRTLADRLKIRAGAACLQIERWTWRLADGVTYARQIFPADRFELVAQFTPGAQPLG